MLQPSRHRLAPVAPDAASTLDLTHNLLPKHCFRSLMLGNSACNRLVALELFQQSDISMGCHL